MLSEKPVISSSAESSGSSYSGVDTLKETGNDISSGENVNFGAGSEAQVTILSSQEHGKDENENNWNLLDDFFVEQNKLKNPSANVNSQVKGQLENDSYELGSNDVRISCSDNSKGEDKSIHDIVS